MERFTNLIPDFTSQAGLPNLKSVLVRSSKKGLGFCKDPNLTHITEMLSHCSALEVLTISVFIIVADVPT